MSKKSSKDYFGFGRIVSLILAIIPITALVLGVATRIKEGKIVAGILRIVLGWNIIWILDIVFMFLNGRIWRFLNV
jgi:hypothetical protein